MLNSKINHHSLIIEFDPTVGKQIKVNKRAEFTFPNRFGTEIEAHNNFPQQYKVIINDNSFTGGLYINPRPYYYFEIHKEGHPSFFKFVESKAKFHAKADLINKIVYIE